MDKRYNNYIIIGIIGLIILGVGTKKVIEIYSDPPLPENVWQEQYRQELINNNIDLQYTTAQRTIDYLTPELQSVIDGMDATSPEDLVKKATRYVLSRIKYSSNGITASYCFSETATSAYLSQTGDCVSMVKLGTALLRGQGMAVRTVGGCVKFLGSCTPIMGTIPIPLEKALIFDGKKRGGFLHEWTEVWIPSKGWVLVDFTNGAIYENGCRDYITYAYDEANYKDICVIEDDEFNRQCWGDLI